MPHPPAATTHHLSTLPGITHGFFGRRGGCSTGLYDSLNIGEGSGDTPRAIIANRNSVRNGVQAEHLLSCYQVHSATVIHAEAPFAQRPEADAMVTATPGLALCILSADCVPVLFGDAQAGIIGAAHAGWKGALGGIIEATIKAMEDLGAQRANLTAAIGPAIQQASYEVGPEFRDTFVGQAEWSDRLFEAGTGDRLQFDLPGFVRAALLSEGIGAVDNLGHDTCAMADTYFSNRRRNLRGEPDYGRNGSVIVLNTAQA